MQDNKKAYVELKHINKTFNDYKASDDVSFSVEKGKLIGLLGPSGSGKTTILRILAGLENADSGEIYIDGKQVNNIPASKRKIGFVFQNYALFRYKTVYDNIAFGLKIQKKSRAEIKERVYELIELVGLRGFEKRYPAQLSGGQRQRVAFARALATQPHLLLLDEPFAAIDAKVRKELRSWLRELINRVGITSIFVTHDQEEAMVLGDQIAIMDQGKLVQIGKPEEVYLHPQNDFARDFLGISNRFTDIHGNTICCRPEELEFAAEGSVKGIVRQEEFLGFYRQYYVETMNHEHIIVRTDRNIKVEEGKEVQLRVK